MLVLTRKIDESIFVGDDVQIFVVGIKGDKVRIGIKAPRDIPVHREEVYLEIKELQLESQEKGSECEGDAEHLRRSGDGDPTSVHPEESDETD